jgi:hypothetical protein
MLTVELWREDTGDVSAYLRLGTHQLAAQAPTAAKALQQVGEMLDGLDDAEWTKPQHGYPDTSTERRERERRERLSGLTGWRRAYASWWERR